MSTDESQLSAIRLMHLVSPSLPVGAFAYSQGLEWAVECGWVSDENDLEQWIENLLQTNLTFLDVPVLVRLYQACMDQDLNNTRYWTDYLLACRETNELRMEERNRGRAMASLLPQLGVGIPENYLPVLNESQLTGFALASADWKIPVREAVKGYLWGWLENMTLAGVKIIPLGQSAGQRILTRLSQSIPSCMEQGFTVPDAEIGRSSPAQAIASSLHETQYTRIYRS